ncbi:polyprenyl synthetase family protein [Candidatus Micrarchaeota archaeon]|nr:polyprenyl synthetase family protein [Candidatus Micrarchaeota archaeon]
MDIKVEIKKFVPEIEASMQELLPKKYNSSSISKTSGKINYELDLQAINGSINTPFWDLLERGGKRWRPALLLMTCEALGKDYKKALNLAALVELTHNATLVADDVEDSSDERRGKPCLHHIYGIDIAINAGNSVYFIPAMTILNSPYSSELRNELMNVFLIEMVNVSIGQGIDIYWHRGLKEEVSEAQYLQMAAFKTGCLSRMACRLASVHSSASKEQVDALGDFGESIGVAFQIQDDVLNLTADEEYGKEIGGDISEGKRTLMTIHAMQHSPKAARLKEILNMHTKDQKLIKEAIEIIKQAGSIDHAVGIASSIVEKSWSKIDSFLPENQGKLKLKALAEYLITRKY